MKSSDLLCEAIIVMNDLPKFVAIQATKKSNIIETSNESEINKVEE